jgi:NAD(P)H-flavin reductase
MSHGDLTYGQQISVKPISRQSGTKNIYLPKSALIQDIIEENETVKTFVLAFEDALCNAAFTYEPGQFMMVSIPHCGEAPISFSSAPGNAASFCLTIRKAGKLTGVMHELQKGDVIGLRGPYGRSFPLTEFQKHNVLFVAGGIGIAPLRSVILYCLANREQFGKISIIYGSRHPDEICFKENIKNWQEDDQVDLHLTVDQAGDRWEGNVGLVTSLLDKVRVNPVLDKAVVCGPGIMIRFVLEQLERMGFAAENLVTTLERQMKCGVGLCGHCYMDEKLVCKEGPVFSRNELSRLEIL